MHRTVHGSATIVFSPVKSYNKYMARDPELYRDSKHEGLEFVTFINSHTQPSPNSAPDKSVQRTAYWQTTDSLLSLPHKSLAFNGLILYSYGSPVNMEAGEEPDTFTIDFYHDKTPQGYVEYNTRKNVTEFVDFNDLASTSEETRFCLRYSGFLLDIIEKFTSKHAAGEMTPRTLDYKTLDFLVGLS